MEQAPEEAPQVDRRIAAGGWRRALVGLAVGALAGAAIALVLPRDNGPRRRDLASDRRADPGR